MAIAFGEDEYMEYLSSISAENTRGYFSIDKRNNRITDRITDRREYTSDDVDAYNLIMKDKEAAQYKEPVRFIFSHSAYEGWTTLMYSRFVLTKRLRCKEKTGSRSWFALCVNYIGERMDSGVLGSDVHNINVLTVVANESYDSFSRQLQSEIAEL